jgi:hypothetical protein
VSIVGNQLRQLTRDEECKRILQQYGPTSYDRISEALDRQFRTIHNRAQLLLGVCGVLISASVLVTTGRLIGRGTGFQHHSLAGGVLILAGVLEISAAVLLVGGVLNVRWITQQPGDDLQGWVLTNLAYRDHKTRAYRVACVLVLLSMACYQTAIAVTLLEL